MRCLNCGNDNPPDNVYCNECGARLQEMSSPDLAAEGGVNLGSGSGSNTDTSMSAASPIGESATQTYTAHGTGPTHEHEAPVDHVTFAPAGTASGDGGAAHATSVGSHYMEEHDAGMSSMGAQSWQDTHVSDVDHASQQGYASPPYAGGAMDVSSASPSMDSQQEVPLTEDTMAATGYDAPTHTGGSQHEHTDMAHVHGTDQASDDGSAAMPGVVPIAEDQQEPPVVASYDEISPAAAGTPAAPDMSQATAAADTSTSASAGSADSREWATQALHQLDEAQQAMARGDFMGFGQSLGNLRSFLEGIINSSPATGAAGGAATMTPSPGPADASQQQGYTMPAGESAASAAPSQAAPTLEPAAEAGSLGVVGGAAAGAAGAAGAAAASGPAGIASAADQGGFVPAVSQDGQPSVARLVVISTGAELPLPEQEEIVVGREDPSSGIFPDVDLTPYGGEEGGVSRRHARLLRIGDDYYVEDLQSTNYTKLDGQRLPAHVRERLEDSARLDFGRVAVIFRRS